MQRLTSFLIATSLVIATVAFAQSAADPAQPGTTPRPGISETMVRFLHASPNVDAARIMLVDRNGAAAHEAVELGYLETTEYVRVFEGSYDIVVETVGADGETTRRVLDDTFGATSGLYLTVALIGLVMPEHETDDDGGFIGWLQGLFTDDRPELGLRALVLEDHSTRVQRVGNVEVRLLHAAPGTDDVDLVITHEGSASVLGTASFGNWTSYEDFRSDGVTLQVRASGSDLVIVDLADVDLSEERLHTVVLVGTPIEDVPLDTVVLSSEWLDPLLMGPGAAGMRGALTPEATAWVLDFVTAAEARLAEAEERLEALGQVEAAQEDARVASEAVREARDLLFEARTQLQGVTAPGAVPPTAPDEEPGAEPASTD